MSDTPTVKKAYVELIDFLAANKDKKVRNIFDEAVAFCVAKSAGGVATASHKVDGVVVAIRCAHFGLWFPTSHVEFGAKAGSATGFNSMCKEGANAFSKSQRVSKQAKTDLLTLVAEEKVSAANIPKELAKIEKARTATPVFSVPGMGWESLEECTKQSKKSLDALVAAAAPKEEAED